MQNKRRDVIVFSWCHAIRGTTTEIPIAQSSQSLEVFRFLFTLQCCIPDASVGRHTVQDDLAWVGVAIVGLVQRWCCVAFFVRPWYSLTVHEPLSLTTTAKIRRGHTPQVGPLAYHPRCIALNARRAGFHCHEKGKNQWVSWSLHLLECRTRDRKVASSNPGRSGGRIFFSRVNFVCRLLFGIRSIPVLPKWHVRDPGHSVNSAGCRLHLNVHTPLTQRGRSGLTMPLSRHSVGTH